MKNAAIPPPARPPREPLSVRLRRFLRAEDTREFLLIAAAVFVVALMVTLQSRPIDTHPEGGDCSYYYQNAVKFSKVWERPFHYIPGLVFNSLGTQELLDIGFNHYGDIDSFFRAPLYCSFLSLWMTVFGGSQLSLLLSQDFLLAVMFGLMFLLMKTFAGRLAAFLGTFLALFYLYFYLDALMTMTEIFQAIFTLALFLHAQKILLSGTRRVGPYAWLAVLAWLFALTKMPMKYLVIALIPLFLFFDQTTRTPAPKLVRRETIVFVGLYILLSFFSSAILSRGMPDPKPVTTMGWRNYYAGGCLESEGFNSSTGGHKKEFRDNIGRGRDEFWFNRYSEICKFAVIDTVKHDPLGYAGMTLKKFWVNIGYGPFQYSEFLTGLRQPFNRFHQVLLFLTILFFFAVRTGSFGWYKSFLLFNAGYLSFIYGLSNPDPRYLFNIAPFYFVSIVCLAKEFIGQRAYRKPAVLLGAAATVLAFLLLRREAFAGIFVNADVIVVIRFLIASGLIVVLGLLLKLPSRFRDFRNSFHELAVLAAVFLIMTGCFLDDRRINHFPVAAKQLDRRVVLPSSYTNGMEHAFIAVDLRSAGTNGRSVTIILNGRVLTNIRAARTGLDLGAQFPVPAYFYFEPHWICVGVDPSLIRATNEIRVVNSGNQVFYRKSSASGLLPSFFHQLGAAQVYGQFSTRERRVYLKQEIRSLGSVSLADGRPVKGDLNLFLVVKRKGAFYLERRNDGLNTMNMKGIALYDPLDNGLVLWSEKDPGPAFEKANANLAGYLAGEYDRFKSPYLLY